MTCSQRGKRQQDESREFHFDDIQEILEMGDLVDGLAVLKECLERFGT